MSVSQLQTYNFRNIISSNIHLDDKLNFITGSNGSGKSSLLESLFYLAHGKSFRTNDVDNLIQSSSDEFVVTAITENNLRLGIQRKRKQGSLISVNGDRFNKLSELARNIAVQIITPESFRLFFGGPRERRKFVDLGLFHVEQSFSNTWKNFSRVLKQRNSCLKQRQKGPQIKFWNDEFCKLSELVTIERENYINKLRKELDVWINKLMPNVCNEISVLFVKGWSEKKTLSDTLADHNQREYEKGYSLYGAHKFDVKFSIDGLPIEQRLSRGQQKLFLLALTFSQANLISKVKQVKPILLIDDIGAELDVESRIAISNIVNDLDCQIIITAIDTAALEPMFPSSKDYNMFHVEHGTISPIRI